MRSERKRTEKAWLAGGGSGLSRAAGDVGMGGGEAGHNGENPTRSGNVYGMTTSVSGRIICAGECAPTGSVKVTVTTYLTHTSGLPPFTASGTLNAEGRYSVSFTGLPHGVHSMKIEYPGDDRHAASMDADQLLSI